MKPYVIVGGVCLLLVAGVVSMNSSPKAILAGLARVQQKTASSGKPETGIPDQMISKDEMVAAKEVAGSLNELAVAGGENGSDQNQRTERQFKDVTVPEGIALIEANEANPNFVILDVRTLEEFEAGHLAKATLLDFYASDFRTELNKLDKSKIYLVYCRSGNRSGQTMRMMQADGFTMVYNLLGGITKWYEADLPLESAFDEGEES